MSSLATKRFQCQCVNCGYAGEDNQKRSDVECARESEYRAVTKSMIQQIADDFSKRDSSHCAAKSNQPSDRANDLLREQVSRKNHD